MGAGPAIFLSRHARERMAQRGVTEEVRETVQSGELVGTRGPRRTRVKVFTGGYYGRGRHHPHKRVVFVEEERGVTVIAVLAEYGRWGGGG